MTIQTVNVAVQTDGQMTSVDGAIRFIEAYDESAVASRFCRYEVNVRYSNGDEVRANFASKLESFRFLKALRSSVV